MHRNRILLGAVACLALVGCESLGDVNLLTLEEDQELGAQLHAEILADPDTYPVVPRADAPEAYGHLDRIFGTVLDTGEVEHETDFAWELTLLHDDEVLNAFATPGGYVYVYTGLIRYLDHEDELAGVLGHEVAHADLRHSSQQLTKAYGLGVLVGVVFGDNPGIVPEIAAGLASLQFSRSDESEADLYSVIYLCETDYAADGAAGFFAKMLKEGGQQVPDFLSTHPSSESRVEDIRAEADARGCSDALNAAARWEQLLASLP